jgi:hypothetical protein
VRYREGGELEFLDRVGDLVKIRGVRFQFGEIEELARRYPGVTQAAAAIRVAEAGDQILVLYYAGDQSVCRTNLRSYLQRHLPEPLVPGVFARLGQLPLSGNGKLDREMLPWPASDGETPNPPSVPSTVLEVGIALIWCEVLGLENVSAEDDFFQAGGHSLLATQVLSRVQQVFGVDLPLRAIFDHPTVSGMSEGVLKALREAKADEKLAALTAPAGRAQDGPSSMSANHDPVAASFE